MLQGTDSAAAVVVDGQVVAAAAEERFSRVKHTGAFPGNAIRYCLSVAGADIRDVEAVAHGFDYGASTPLGRLDPFHERRYRSVFAPEVQRDLLARHFPGTGVEARLRPVGHHLAHAASAYLGSGFEDALVLVTDGMGERESATVYAGRGGRIETIDVHSATHSLGTLYGVFTHYLGFWFNSDEYKVMGLAPYGDPAAHLDLFLERFVRLLPEGRYAVPLLTRNRTLIEAETYAGSLAELEAVLGPAREPGSPIEPRHLAIAAALQAVLERAIHHQLAHHREATALRRLCLAGGVALNCSNNGRLLRSGLFDDIFVVPPAGDDGTAIGAALAVAAGSGSFASRRLSVPLLGPAIGRDDIEAALQGREDIEVTALPGEPALLAAASEALASGQILACARGRMEFGPRALGARSILADPRRADMRDRINALVKKREEFRPFAPAVLAEAALVYFDIPDDNVRACESMLFVSPVRPEWRTQLPAVTHVDGSARAQTVDRGNNPEFWQMIDAFGRLTGMPVLLNTSFNVAGQPIVCTAKEAIDTLLLANLDGLILGSAHLVRPRRRPAG